MRTLVTMKSTAITATELATTGSLVALPTPCVPPVVRSPTWQPIVTMREPEEDRLDQAHPDVLDVEALDDAGPVDGAGDVELQHGHDPAADHADPGGQDAQQRHHHDAGEHARHDQLADRVGAERAQRRDLIRDEHRAELGRDARADAARHHQAGEHRAELLDHRRADQAADHRPRAELVERDARVAAPAPSR